MTDKPENFLFYIEVGDPDYQGGEVTEKMIKEAAHMLREMGPDDAAVFPWHTTPKALPLEEPVGEVPVVPYTVEEEDLTEYFGNET
jgi:hypothetical protein